MADAVKNGDFYESGKTAILTYMGNSGSTKPPIFRTSKKPIFRTTKKWPILGRPKKTAEF